jgi:uncharacterized Ntn-hydrolase superfamily protein
LAGEEEGGDARGKQSAALLVVKEKAGYGGYTDRALIFGLMMEGIS